MYFIDLVPLSPSMQIDILHVLVKVLKLLNFNPIEVYIKSYAIQCIPHFQAAQLSYCLPKLNLTNYDPKPV